MGFHGWQVTVTAVSAVEKTPITAQTTTRNSSQCTLTAPLSAPALVPLEKKKTKCAHTEGTGSLSVGVIHGDANHGGMEEKPLL